MKMKNLLKISERYLMSRICIAVIGLSIITCSGCRKDNSKYYFFTKNELELLWEDVNPAMDFQNRLKSGKAGEDEVYQQDGTVKFMNPNGDVIEFIYQYGLSSLPAPVEHSSFPMKAYSRINTFMFFHQEFIQSIAIDMYKGLDRPTSSYIFSIGFRDGTALYSNFSLTEDILTSIQKISSSEKTDVYLKTSLADYSFNGESLKNCLFFKITDLEHNEMFRFIYTNKYGFIKFIKSDGYEITRCL